MASISKLSNNSSVYGGTNTKSIGGLASGLDTDALIEGMTSGTRGKINKNLQKKQSLQWQMDAYRGVSSKLVEFSQKYTNYTSKTNLSSPDFFARTKIEALGVNNKYVGVSGKMKTGNNFSLAGIRQLAKDTVATSTNNISDQKFESGIIDMMATTPESNIEGKTLTISYGADTYYVTMKRGTDSSDGYVYDYTTKEKAIASINHSLSKVSIGNNKTLSDKIEFTGMESDGTTEVQVDSDGNKLNPSQTTAYYAIKSIDPGETNTIKIAGGDKSIMGTLGLKKDDTITNGVVVGRTPGALTREVPFGKSIADKSITFNYNGTRRNINMPTIGELSTLAGSTIQVNYNGNNYSVTLDSKLDYTSIESIADSFNASLKKAKDSSNATVDLSGKVVMSPVFQNDKAFSLKIEPVDVADSVQLMSGSTVSYKDPDGTLHAGENALSILGFTSGSDTGTAVATGKLVNLSKQDLEDNIQKQLDTSFGRGRIKLSDTGTGNNLKLEFAAMDPINNVIDTSSVFSIITASDGLLGNKGILKMNYGQGNRLNMSEEVGKLGTRLPFNITDYADASGNLNLEINGVSIQGLTTKSSLNDVVSKINGTPGAGVKLRYEATSDKFSISSTDPGASGQIAIGADPANPSPSTPGNFLNALLGVAGTDYTITQGQDAIIGVVYEGSSDVVELTRSANNIELDGLILELKDEFGYNAGTNTYDTPVSDYVKFNGKVDSDKIVKAVEEMIKDYNDIVDLVNKEVSEKKNRNYEPLTDEQREGMTESQIKIWEEKAKEGILFNNPDIRGLCDGLRTVFSSLNLSQTSELGISISGSWKDNGKLVFNETEFRVALETNTDTVIQKFTKLPDEVKDPITGKVETKVSTGGFMARLKDTTDKYAKTEGTPKGILIEKAGSPYSPLSLLKNSLLTQMDDIDDQVDILKKKLKVETDRYTRKFTQLEQLVSQMNSQSSWLNQQ